MPPSSPASSEGSTGMVPYSHRIRGSVSRRDRRMMNRSCSTEGGLRVRPKISRDSGQCGCGVSAPQWAIGLPSGEVLEEFEIAHRPEGFAEFFSRIEKQQKIRGCEVAVAIEGFNGCARPLDAMVRRRGYRLYNINNLKLARFKEIFPGAAKSDRIDARKGLELFQLSDHLPMAKEVLQEVKGTPQASEDLNRLSRRRRRLVDERVRVVNNLQADLQPFCT